MAVKPAAEKKTFGIGAILVVLVLLAVVALAAVAMPFVGNSNRRAASTRTGNDGPTLGGLLGGKPAGSPVAEATKNVLTLPAATNVSPAVISKLLADGDRAFAAGKLSDARYYYFKAQTLDPLCETCISKRKQMESALLREIDEAMRSAASYTNTGRYDEAIRAYERVQFLDADPNGQNYVNAARLISETKKLKEDMAQR